MGVEWVSVDDRDRGHRERQSRPGLTIVSLAVVAFVVTAVVVIATRMSDETLSFAGGVLVGGVIGLVLGVTFALVLGRRVSALESVVRTRQERGSQDRNGWGGPASPVVVVAPPGGYVGQQQRWPDAGLPPAHRSFHEVVVGGRED